MFIYIDDYNLVYKKTGNIYTAESERISKYLFTYKYIPENFDGLLLGPSLGDQINTEKLVGHKVYNLSLNGANISELKTLLENVLKHKHKIKIVILTLHPYITQSSGLKTAHLTKNDYWGSYTSIEILKTQLRKIVVEHGLSIDYFNSYGYMNMNLKKNDINGEEEAIKYIKKNEFIVDDKALSELKMIIELLHENNIQIVSYFHPDPFYAYKSLERENIAYKTILKNMFDINRNDIVLDLNDDKFDDFRSDYTNYKDGAHLSYKGEEFIVNKLNEILWGLKN